MKTSSFTNYWYYINFIFNNISYKNGVNSLMFPYIFKLDGFEIRIYSLMYIIALIIAFYYTRRKSASLGYNKDLIENAIIWTFFGAIIGARLYYVILLSDFYKEHPFEIIAIWHGGLQYTEVL